MNCSRRCGRSLFLGADVLHRVEGTETAFVTLTRFDSLDAIPAFAGDQYDTPVIEPRAGEFLSRYDVRELHFSTLRLQPVSATSSLSFSSGTL